MKKVFDTFAVKNIILKKASSAVCKKVLVHSRYVIY